MLKQLWPVLRQHAPSTEAGDAAKELEKGLADAGFYEQLTTIEGAAAKLDGAYADLYRQRHGERDMAVLAAIDAIKGTPEWTDVFPRDPKEPPTDAETSLLTALQGRLCQALDRPEGGAVCLACQATLAQMESDIAAVPALRAQAVSRLQELATPDQPVAHLRLADLITEPLDSEGAVRRFVESLEAQLRKLVSEGARIVID